MRLDFHGDLSLFKMIPWTDPLDYDPTPTINLNPKGDSYFDYMVRFRDGARVAPKGDLDMGDFTSGPQP